MLAHLKMVQINVPLERITLQLEDGKTFKVPLSEMEIVGEGKRPNRISEEVFEKYASTDPFALFQSASATSDLEVSSFTTEDKLADPKARPMKQIAEHTAKEDAHRRPRRRRRSVEVSADGTVEVRSTSQEGAKDSSSRKRNQGAHQKQDAAETSLRGRDGRRDRKDKNTRRDSSKQKNTESSDSSRGINRRQRRSAGLQRQDRTQAKQHDACKSLGEKRDRGERADRSDRSARSERVARGERGVRNDRTNKANRDDNQRSRRRPGQKSSGIRNAPVKSHQQNNPTAQKNRQTSLGETPQVGAHRKPRRRHHKAGGE